MARPRKKQSLLDQIVDGLSQGFWGGIYVGLGAMLLYYGADFIQTVSHWNWKSNAFANLALLPFYLLLILPYIVFWGLLLGVPSGVLCGGIYGYFQYARSLKSKTRRKRKSSAGQTTISGLKTLLGTLSSLVRTLWAMALDQPVTEFKNRKSTSRKKAKPRRATASAKTPSLRVKAPKMAQVKLPPDEFQQVEKGDDA